MAGGELVFITGGVRSGKSTFAEQYGTNIAKQSKKRKLHYVACGQKVDHEMIERIKIHQDIRRKNVIPWTTWEQPTNLGKIANKFTTNDIVLIDCLTTLLGNELFARATNNEIDIKHVKTEITTEIVSSLKKLKQNASLVIVVSNELLNEPLSSSSLTFTYSYILGHLHQVIVRLAEYFFIVEMGLPLLIKGEEPYGKEIRHYNIGDIIRCR